MTKPIQSKRALLKLVVATLTSPLVLSACDSTKKKSQEVNQKLLTQLHHHGVAAHLGRVNQENNPSLQSKSLQDLVVEILADLGLDIDTLTENDVENLPNLLAEKIRLDFSQERVLAVDGWLLSETEVKICTLILRNIEQANS